MVFGPCLLYTSDAADDMQCVDLGGRRIIKKKKTQKNRGRGRARRRCCCFFFFKQKTAYEIGVRLVGSEMCIRDSPDGGRIQAGLGRFGPYVVWDKSKGEKDYRSLKGEDDVLAVGLSRALELLAMPKRGRGGQTALKDLSLIHI